ncbi:TetR/AcrR family transcriptional regulator [Actinomadura formosensis]|uniref:TetR/AcrR family transcriptional regulator n=1 Tax=Actinomadura formosensis TaxID=60706 RepID=UPI0008329116|nr:TetR/AcrR family transcriptional regulator [Actinomadura formosensis]
MNDSTETSGRSRRARLSPEQRRESILAAATEVFAATGYRAGKVRDVADRIGVSEPVIFQNFGSKAALFTAVLDRALATVESTLSAMADQAGSVSESLAEALSPGHVEALHAPGSLGMLFADAAALTDEPGVADAARRAVQRMAAMLTGLLRRGQEDGDIRPDLDPGTGAWWILSLLSARRFRTAVLGDGHGMEADLTALTLRTLTGRPPPP